MRALLFTILVAALVLSCHVEARRMCPNKCTSKRKARRQCRLRGRRVNCKVVGCGRRKRACVPLAEPLPSATPTPSQSPSASPSPSMSSTPSSSPSVSPTPSASPTPSTTPTASPTPSTTPSITPSPSPTPVINTLSDIRGVSCPPGTSPGSFGGDTCDLTSLRVVLAVAPSTRFGFPPRANCPDNIVAGGGRAGCTFCGDDSSNTARELLVTLFNSDAGCTLGLELTGRIGEYLEATAIADGVDLCPRNFDVDDGGSYITQVLASKFQDIVNAALCSPDATFRNVLSEVSGVACPPGTSPGPFGGDTCDLTSLRVTLAVAPSVRFGFPPRANCPDSIVAGGGGAGCTFCGDDSSNTARELLVDLLNASAGCSEGVDLTRRIGESIEATATADGVDLCPREFDADDGGSYITLVLPSKFQNVVNDALCV